MSNDNSPMQQLYDMMKHGNLDSVNNQDQKMNPQPMPPGGQGFQMNPQQQNQWGNQPAMGQFNQGMPNNNQNMFMNQPMFWGNNPNMMMQNQGMFFGYGGGFMPQQPMFQNQWQFQQNQVNSSGPQQQQPNDANAQFWTLTFENTGLPLSTIGTLTTASPLEIPLMFPF